MKLGTVHQMHMFTKPLLKVGGEICLLNFLLYAELDVRVLIQRVGKCTHYLSPPPIPTPGLQMAVSGTSTLR